MPKKAVRLGFVAVALIASASAVDAQRNADRIMTFPAFRDYPGDDSAVIYVVNIDRVRTSVVKPGPGEPTGCSDDLAIDGFRLSTVTGDGWDVSPGKHRFQFQHVLAYVGTYRYDRIESIEKTLTTGEVYGLVIVCNPQRSNVVSKLSWLPMGPIAGLKPFAQPENKLSDEALVVEAVNRIVTTHNAYRRVRRFVSIDGKRLAMPAGLVAGVDAQRLVDATRASADCTSGTPVLMREGLTSAGQRLSLWLQCRSSPTPVWQTLVRIGGIDIEQKFVRSLLAEKPRELYAFYLWLLEQKLKPPADQAGHLAEEVRNILRGDAPLRPLRNPA